MKFVTDSTADLSKELMGLYRVDVVPLTIHLGEKKWLDFYEIGPDEFYALLRASRDFPTTSQPSPQDFINAYRPSVEKGEPIISIHLSSTLSGTYQSAMLAKSHFPDARIEVIDSLQASLGLSLIIIICAREAARGASFDTVAATARTLSKRVDTYFSVDSLDYLQRGGRIGKAQALLGSLMKIKPLLKVVDGSVHPVEKIRTTERLLNRFVELVEQGARERGKLLLSVGESDNSEIMNGLVERLRGIPNVSLVYRCKIGGVVVAHAGPGALGISFVEDFSD